MVIFEYFRFFFHRKMIVHKNKNRVLHFQVKTKWRMLRRLVRFNSWQSFNQNLTLSYYLLYASNIGSRPRHPFTYGTSSDIASELSHEKRDLSIVRFCIMSLIARKPVFGICYQGRLTPVYAVTETGLGLKCRIKKLEVLYHVYLGSEQQRR